MNSKSYLSAIILTKNEEQNILDCRENQHDIVLQSMAENKLHQTDRSVFDIALDIVPVDMDTDLDGIADLDRQKTGLAALPVDYPAKIGIVSRLHPY